MNGRPWTQRELRYLRRHYSTATAAEIAAAIGRSVSAIHNRDRMERLTKVAKHHMTPEREALLRKRHAEGWSDSEIAAVIGCERHTVGDWRKRLGLPTVVWSPHQRARVRAKTTEQLRKAGLKTLADLRVAVFQKRAREAGWPDDLRPRSVQILTALWERGPMTRREHGR